VSGGGLGDRQRRRFDTLLEEELERLPPALAELLEEAPLVVDDRPEPELLADLGMDGEPEALCGLHSGIPLTERSVEEPWAMEVIHLFRMGIIAEAGGEDATEEDLRREIRVTLLHEIGHHFGLDEDDLAELGFD
jgi:predicted Zn-dependent protease with MMP-like domain